MDFSKLYDIYSEHRTLIACTASSVFGLFVFRRVFVVGKKCKSTAKLLNKTVLITGANTGIGKETAKDLARRGARVLLACRNISKAEDAAAEIRKSTGNNDVEVYGLDLASLKSVRKCAKDVIDRETRLDVLINNAGVMFTPYSKTEDGFEMQMGTNHFGHFLFTNLLLDLLKKSTPSRIVVVSSVAHWNGEIKLDDINSDKGFRTYIAYAQSKLANILFCRELSKRLKDDGVTANCLHPGVINTELFSPLSKEYGFLATIVYSVAGFITRPIFLKTPVQGAQTTIHLAVSEELENVSGKYFKHCTPTKPSPQAEDDEMAAKLWELSQKMVGLTDEHVTYT